MVRKGQKFERPVYGLIFLSLLLNFLTLVGGTVSRYMYNRSPGDDAPEDDEGAL